MTAGERPPTATDDSVDVLAGLMPALDAIDAAAAIMDSPLDVPPGRWSPTLTACWRRRAGSGTRITR